MFFILSINTVKHTASIVGHALTLDEAIQSVKEHAKAYVVAKNEPVLHRGSEGDSLKFTDRVTYYTKDSTEVCHQIDVFRQQTHKIKGWTGSTYHDDSLLVRRFAYNEHSFVKEEAENDEEFDKLRAARAKEMGLRHTNTVGGFPNNVIADLRESQAFQKLKNSSAKNKLPPPYKHTIFVDSSDSDEDWV